MTDDKRVIQSNQVGIKAALKRRSLEDHPELHSHMLSTANAFGGANTAAGGVGGGAADSKVG